jgi:uncharacterized membrane protein (UPF0136 family)
MSANSFIAKFLRFLGILLMGLTGGVTLLGGIGLSCVAFNPTGFSESMSKLAPFQWLYIIFMLAGIALGLLGIYAAVMLAKGRENSYRLALYVLVASILLGTIHILVSRALRGKSMPVDAVVYTAVLTLIVFLLFRIPSVWQAVNFARGDARSNQPAGGALAIALGLLALTIQYIMGPSHTWDHTNYANAFNLIMTVTGLVCLILGCAILILPQVLKVKARHSVLIQKPSPEG